MPTRVVKEPIGSLVPAPEGWRAVYRGEDKRIFTWPVWFFAVCRVVRENAVVGEPRNPERQPNEVVGLAVTELGIELVDGSENFLGYLAPGEGGDAVRARFDIGDGEEWLGQ